MDILVVYWRWLIAAIIVFIALSSVMLWSGNRHPQSGTSRRQGPRA